MADKHSLNYEVRELKLGASFTNNKAAQYHTIKYDFKPASVDMNKMATVDVGTNNQVTVTVPHLDGAGVPQTVFKGNQRPYAKECVLIIDRVTGEVTLEKLSTNIQVKKTRQESVQKPRPLTPALPPSNELTNTTQRSSSRTRVATGMRANRHAAGASNAAPSAAGRFPGAPPAAGAPGANIMGAANAGGNSKPSNLVRSPLRVKTSPPQAAPWSGGGNSTLASLPMIGMDDAPAPPAHFAQTHAPHTSHVQTHTSHVPTHMSHVPTHTSHVPTHTSHVPTHTSHVPAHLPTHAAPRAPERPFGAPDRSLNALDRHNANVIPPAPPANTHQPPQDDSSSSSSSDSGSESDSDSDSDHAPQQRLPNGNSANTSLPSDVLKDDLCLSESGSDSD